MIVALPELLLLLFTYALPLVETLLLFVRLRFRCVSDVDELRLRCSAESRCCEFEWNSDGEHCEMDCELKK